MHVSGETRSGEARGDHDRAGTYAFCHLLERLVDLGCPVTKQARARQSGELCVDETQSGWERATVDARLKGRFAPFDLLTSETAQHRQYEHA